MAAWIFELDVFDGDCVARMMAHCRERGITSRAIRIAPFTFELEGHRPVLPEGEPVVCYASIGVQALAPRLGWLPGVFEGAFEGRACRDRLGPAYLNHDAVVLPLSEVAARLDIGRDWFIKPDADSKEFAGRVFVAGAFEPWLAEMRRIGYLPAGDFPVAVSAPKALAAEIRLVVVDGMVVAGSFYKEGGRPRIDADIPRDELQRYVRQIEARFRPAAIYDVDVAMMGGGGAGDGWRVVEYSTFNTSSLYACDVGDVIDAVSAAVDAAR